MSIRSSLLIGDAEKTGAVCHFIPLAFCLTGRPINDRGK